MTQDLRGSCSDLGRFALRNSMWANEGKELLLLEWSPKFRISMKGRGRCAGCREPAGLGAGPHD
eukprot:6458935-Pyramimonas_sp.AAC.1